MFEYYYIAGIGAFPQYPIPACCMVDTVRGACCTEYWDGGAMVHECTMRAEMNCDILSGDYTVDALRCLDINCPISCCRLAGDANHDEVGPDIADLVFMVNYMFNGGAPPPCPEEIDVNGDMNIGDIADLVYLVNYMFSGGPPPVPCP